MNEGKHRGFGTVLLLVFLFPVGLFWMWYKKKWNPKARWVVTGIFAFFIFLAIVTSGGEDTQQTSIPTTLPATESNEIILPDYTILNEETYDANIKTQVEQEVLVSGEITEEGLDALLTKLYSSIKQRSGYKYHDSPTAIYVRAYYSKELYDSQHEGCFAVMLKNHVDPGPKFEIIEFEMRRYKASLEPSQEKLGLSEDQRKQIFKEDMAVVKSARLEAWEKYPIDPWYHLQRGQLFKLTERETPLCPEFEPEDPTEAILKIRQLPPGSTIKVLKIKTRESTPWYFVEVVSKTGQSLGSGWINGIALINQGGYDVGEQMDKSNELQESLEKTYKTNLAEKYKLNLEQLERIADEGLGRGWPY